MSDSFITNYKVAQTYGVTPTTVQNWVERAMKDENDLEIGKHEDRFKIKDTVKNHKKLLMLSKKAQSFDRYKENPVEIKIPESIYSTYSTQELYQIIKGLRSGEVPLKYAYIGKGAELWSKFYAGKQTSNIMLSSYLFLIESEFTTLVDSFTKDGVASKINVVDIGCGDGSPTIPLLEKLHQLEMLNAYVALDISQQLIEKVREKMHNHPTLSGIEFHGVRQDFDAGLPIDFLAELNQGQENVIPTLFISFGGQLQNNELHEQIRIMGNIRFAMNNEDKLLIINTKYNKGAIPDYAAFDKSRLYDFLTWLPKEMGLGENYFTPVLDYDEASRKRALAMKLNTPIELNFERLYIKVLLQADQKVSFWKHRREDVESVVQVGKSVDLELEMYKNNRDKTSIIYMFGIPNTNN